MTKLARIIFGKFSNKALNIIVNAAGLIATALTITTVVAVFAPDADTFGSYDPRPNLSEYNQQSGACSIGYGCK